MRWTGGAIDVLSTPAIGGIMHRRLFTQANMEKLRQENDVLKTELAMEFRQFKKPVDSASSDRLAKVVVSSDKTMVLNIAHGTAIVTG